MFLKYLCKCEQGLRLKPFGCSQNCFLGQKYSLWIILAMTGLMPLVFFSQGNLRERALPLFPSGRDPEWEWKGVVLIGAVVFKKGKSVGAHSKRLRQPTSKLCSDATCLVLFEHVWQLDCFAVQLLATNSQQLFLPDRTDIWCNNTHPDHEWCLSELVCMHVTAQTDIFQTQLQLLFSCTWGHLRSTLCFSIKEVKS